MASSSRLPSSFQPPGGCRALAPAIPPLLRPLFRAYILGYGSAVAPRVLTLVLQHFPRRRHKDSALLQPQRPFWESLQRILRSGLDWQRFPTFCAVLVGGSTLLEVRQQ